MSNTLTKISSCSLLALAIAATASAQVKLNDSITVSGWATAAYKYTKVESAPSTDSYNLDAALLSAVITPTKQLTINTSLYYRPGSEGGVSPSGSEITLLDAYLSYDAGNGVTLSAGKFLSYLGYESFYNISDNMITLANQDLLAPIPGYHEGVKIDYAPDKTTSVGVALVDSLFQKPGYNATAGDGELKHNAGVEGYITYTGVTDLTLWGGVGYSTKVKPGMDTSGVQEPNGASVTVVDLWASYQINKQASLAVEEIYKSGGTGNKGSDWLAYFNYAFTDKLSSWFAVSGEDVSSGPRYIRLSVSPNYAITPNLSVRAQYSYTDYSKYWTKHANFLGAEVLVKF